MGRIPETTLGELALRLAELWSTPVRMVGGILNYRFRPRPLWAVRGGDFAAEAKAAGAQVLITGDVSYHDALDALALNLAVLDAGHFATEKIMVRKIAHYLKSQLTAGAAEIIAVVEQPGEDPFRLEIG